jgi:hypothetical protein
VSEKDFDEFMNVLSENIKNLGVRIKQSDKKIERRIKDTILGGLKEVLSPEALDNPLADFKKTLASFLNLKLHECGCYLGLPSEEWAVKIMTNILINGFAESEPPIDEKRREEMIKAQNLFIMPEQHSKGIEIIKSLMKDDETQETMETPEG